MRCLFSLFFVCSLAMATQEKDEQRFQSLYNEVCAISASATNLTPRAAGKIRYGAEPYQALLQMDFPVVPLVVNCCEQARERGSESDFIMATNLWYSLTLQQPNPVFHPLLCVSPKQRWDGGEELADLWTKSLLDQLRRTKKGNGEADSIILQAAIAAQGVFALPMLFEELDSGAEDLMPIFRRFQWPADDIPDMNPDALRKWWQRNRERYRMPHMVPDFRQRYPHCNWLWVETMSIRKGC